MSQSVKSLTTMQETQAQSLGWEDPLEKETATHSCILAWRILGTDAETDAVQTGSSQLAQSKAD